MLKLRPHLQKFQSGGKAKITMLGTHYQESRTPAVWLCISYNQKTAKIKLKKVAGKVGIGEIMELTAENHAQNIERGVYFITEKP